MSEDIDALDLQAGDWLFKQSCEFERGVVAIDQLPPADRPEFAFAGRSNVGKSSLLNALTGRSNLARVSNTPGRTQQLNFFRLPADKRGAYLVDLPGYGFAKAPKKDAKRWHDLMMAYLRGRATLKRVFLLIDARHGLKSTDQPFVKAFDESAVSYQIVLTKTDKPKPGELERICESTAAALKAHVAAHPRLLSTSSVSGEGLSELRAEIADLIDVAQLGYKSPAFASGRRKT
ncbi:MAG TPA: ribosome biogenesis GTP-binding protein YihA/YsxC [Alphaproteobacteria bacterium]|nr:ribosome biogenesis GTP-binding protein YihA/YsxC [Alphaproteobacteria bacterium]